MGDDIARPPRPTAPARAADLVLRILSLACVGALLYSWHRSDLFPPGAMNAYYAASFFGLAAAVFALTRSEPWRINAALLILFLAAPLYLLELGLALVSGGSLDLAREPFGPASKFTAVMTLRAQGIDAWPAFQPSTVIVNNGFPSRDGPLLPLAGLSRKATVLCSQDGTIARYDSDEHGFNNPPGLHTAESMALALVGDSFTQGFCVGQGEDIASLLRARRAPAVNLGIGGNGPLLELATVAEYAGPRRPPIVLWMYFEGNDLRDLANEQTSSLLRRYLDGAFVQHLINRQPEIDAILTDHIREEERRLRRIVEDNRIFESPLFRLLKLKHLRTRAALIRERLTGPPPLSLFEQVLTVTQTHVASWGGRLYFVYLPEWNRYADHTVDHDAFDHRKEVLASAERLHLPVIDVHKEFLTKPDPLSLFPSRLHGHYTPEGYRLVAEAIFRRLTTDGTATEALPPKGPAVGLPH